MANRGSEKERRDLRLEVANRLIERMEQGTAPWQRPWVAGAVRLPLNAVTGKPYSGVNRQQLLLESPDPSDPRWCTYRQAKEQGWQVRAGSKGATVEKWLEYDHERSPAELEELRRQGVDHPEPTEKRLRAKYYTVFHASQIDGIPPLERPDIPHEVDGNPDDRLPKLAEAMGVSLAYGGGRAFYRSSEDRVQMPPIASFATATGHDTTLLHELSHATGHASRLGRELGNPFGSPKYALEELRAEMSAAMTAATLGIGFDPKAQNIEEGRETENSAAYLASWLGALPEKDRKQAIMAAIKDAQGISEYLMARTPELAVQQGLAQGEELLQDIPSEVAPFLGVRQAEVTRDLLRNSEEREFFSNKMRELQDTVRNLPETYQTDGQPDAERMAALRYFGPGNQQWYIIEKDRGDPENERPELPRQTQAYGLADLGMGFPEMGYINIEEITRLGAEIDYHFEPTNLLEVKKDLGLVDRDTEEPVVPPPLVAEPTLDQIRALKPAEIRGREFLEGESARGKLVGLFDHGQVVALEREEGIRYYAGEPYVDHEGKNPYLGVSKETLDRLANNYLQDFSGEEVFVTPSYDGQLRIGRDLERLQQEVRTESALVKALVVAPDLLEHLQKRQELRHDGGAEISRAEEFTRREVLRDPEKGDRWAEALRANIQGYSERVGLPPDILNRIANDMEKAAARARNPEVGDLVRYEPPADDTLHTPFSGRVIAKLDTNTGDHRYHLRAEIGEAKGMETTVYGKDGTFRAASLEEAVGFDRKAPEKIAELDPKEQAIIAYNRFYQQLPANVDTLLQDIEIRFAKVDMIDQNTFAAAMTKTQIQADDVFGIIREGPDRGASRTELMLDQAGVDPEKRAELRHLRWDGFEAQTNRYRDGLDQAREQMKERLKARGRDVLRNPEALSPQELTAACLWKRGIPVSPQSEQIGRFVEAVDKKDLAKLLSSIGHNSQNPGSQEAFSRLTGVPLGKTEKERVAQIKEWAGQEKVAAFEKAQEESARLQAQEAPRRALRRAFDGLTILGVNMDGKSVDGQQFVEAMAKKGFTQVLHRNHGAALQRYLANPETEQTTWLKSSRFQAFCKAVQEVEPSGDLVKAMEAAKIPLEGVSKAPGKEPEKSAEAEKAPNPYEEKQRARQERYRMLAEKMRLRAKAKLDQAHKMAEVIPFGQPILVGHHSEGRDRRYRERIHDTFGNGFKLLDKAQYYENRAARQSNAISADDPEASKKLREKLESLQKSQERMKAANAVIRKFEDREERMAGLQRIGFTPEQAEKILTPDVMGGIGFASYSLSNNNANIRRIEKRIEELEKAATLEDRTTEYPWGSVRENKEINRLQFFFAERPDETVRDLMKKSGFRWAPSEKAWQRQWTGNAVYAAREIVKTLNERYPPEPAQAVPAAENTSRSTVQEEPAHAAARLGNALENLANHSLTLSNADGTQKTINARAYLDHGLRLGMTELEEKDGKLVWTDRGALHKTITDERLATVLRVARAVDKNIGRAIQSVERQKADLEWER